VDALAQAGADIIAFDGTDRLRPATREAIVEGSITTNGWRWPTAHRWRMGVIASNLALN
jgi:hypothetical protein